jgi:hypothetical protein
MGLDIAFEIDFGTKVVFTTQSEKSGLERSIKSQARFHLSHFISNDDKQITKCELKSDSNTFYSILSHLRSVFGNNKVIKLYKILKKGWLD